MYALFNRIFALLVVAPPVYIAFRYLRWYFRSDKQHEREVA